MTKTLVWILVFLATFAALFFLQHLTKDDGTSSTVSGYMEGSDSVGVAGAGGSELVSQFGCLNCHGNDLAGTPAAPPLTGLSKYYDREGLITYLRNPDKNKTGARFDEYKTKYASGIMPAYGNKDLKDLGKIADYLLSK
ncbi:MAG: cytochrome c [Ignavibacteriales bacterium]|jgi:cytochrome c553|nr:cytochrome c [Ignavibacteriales bacterium]MBK8662599.1 cytochrome c [Ignavibacteriales bacterium]MCC6637947.1 cytochrome c [Ignavibacteriaceae bacterium]